MFKNRVIIHCYAFMYFRAADIGLIGLAVMGQNLILNMNDHGFVVSVGCLSYMCVLKAFARSRS